MHHGDEALLYDAAGRLIQDGERRLTWDARGRLVRVERGDVVEEYTYSYDDVRTLKTILQGSAVDVTKYIDKDVEERSGGLVRYVFLGDERIARLDPIEGKGHPAPGMGATIYGPRNWPPRAGWAVFGALLALLGAIGCRGRADRGNAFARVLVNPLSMRPVMATALTMAMLARSLSGCHGSGGPDGRRGRPVDELPPTAAFYLLDHQGTTVVTTDAGGAVLGEAAYHPYGIARTESRPTTEPYGYIGNELDRGAALADFRARPYRPDFGAFLAPDPVAVFQPEKTLLKPRLGWAYAYASDSPVTQSDQSGKEPPAFNSSDAAAKMIVDRFGPQLDEETKRAIEQGQLEGTKLAIDVWLTAEGIGGAWKLLRAAPRLVELAPAAYRAIRSGEALALVRGGLARVWGAVASDGAFTANDVAFGLTRANGESGALIEFGGKAILGTRAPLSEATFALAPGAARNAAIAQDTLRFAESTLGRTGGYLRFNLSGVSLTGATTPGSAVFESVTSAEYRGILANDLLFSRTVFYGTPLP
jgi:RHS repeat-associated protein